MYLYKRKCIRRIDESAGYIFLLWLSDDYFVESLCEEPIDLYFYRSMIVVIDEFMVYNAFTDESCTYS